MNFLEGKYNKAPFMLDPQLQPKFKAYWRLSKLVTHRVTLNHRAFRPNATDIYFVSAAIFSLSFKAYIYESSFKLQCMNLFGAEFLRFPS